MKVQMELVGISERWDAKTNENTHFVELEFNGMPFTFPVTSEVAAGLVRAALQEPGPEQPAVPESSEEPRKVVISLGDVIGEDPNHAQPAGTVQQSSYGDFQVSAEVPEQQEVAPTPSVRGAAPVKRSEVQDGEFCGQG